MRTIGLFVNPHFKLFRPLVLRLVLLVCVFFPALVSAQLEDGEVDPSFIAPPFFTSGGIIDVKAMDVASDGKVIFAGSFDRIDAFVRRGIARMNADGTLDTSFAPKVEGGTVYAVLIQSDGKILIGGDFTSVDDRPLSFLARLNANGSVDSSFVTTVDNAVISFYQRANTHILIGGRFTQINSHPSFFLAQMRLNGTPDTSFVGNALGVVDGSNSSRTGVYAIKELVEAVPADNKILVGGFFGNSAGDTHLNFTRLTNTGAVDGTFTPDFTLRGRVQAITVEDDGDIVFGGGFRVIKDGHIDDQLFLAKADEDGILDTSYLPQPNSEVWGLHTKADGNVIAAGNFSRFQYQDGLPNQQGAAILMPDGTLAASNLPSTTTQVQAMVIQPSGDVVLGGLFGYFDKDVVVRMNVASGVLAEPSFQALKAGAILRSVVTDRSGNVFVGGQFEEVGSTVHDGLVKLNPKGDVVTEFVSQTSGASTMTILEDGRLMVGSGGLKILDPNTGVVDNSFSVSGGSIHKIEELPNGQFLVAGRFKPDGEEGDTKYLVKINQNGTFDSSFVTGFSSTVVDFAITESGKIYVGGYFQVVDAVNRSAIARINSDGTLDTAFNAVLTNQALNPGVLSVVLNEDEEIFIGGEFRNVNTVGQNYVAKLDNTGQLLTDFSPNLARNLYFIGSLGFGIAAPTVSKVLLMPDGKLVIAGSIRSPDGTHATLLRLNANGSLDTSFADQDIESYIGALHVREDGKAMVIGEFNSVGGLARSLVARFDIGLDLTELCFPIVIPSGGATIICL